jgi:hypothetical protein
MSEQGNTPTDIPRSYFDCLNERDRLAARVAELEAKRDWLVEATRELIRAADSENFNRPARTREMSIGLRAALRYAGEAVGAALAESPDRGEQ